jgi:hypothetical protein
MSYSMLFFWSKNSKKTFMSDIDAFGPDLYGPVWITTTIIFWGYFSNSVNSFLGSSVYHYEKLGTTASFFYSFFFIVPLILFGLMKHFNYKCEFVQLMCIYSYSSFVWVILLFLSVFIPSSFQFSLAIIGFLFNFWFQLKHFAPILFIQTGETGDLTFGIKAKRWSSSTIINLFYLASSVALALVFNFWIFPV